MTDSRKRNYTHVCRDCGRRWLAVHQGMLAQDRGCPRCGGEVAECYNGNPKRLIDPVGPHYQCWACGREWMGNPLDRIKATIRCQCGEEVISNERIYGARIK